MSAKFMLLRDAAPGADLRAALNLLLSQDLSHPYLLQVSRRPRPAASPNHGLPKPRHAFPTAETHPNATHPCSTPAGPLSPHPTLEHLPLPPQYFFARGLYLSHTWHPATSSSTPFASEPRTRGAAAAAPSPPTACPLHVAPWNHGSLPTLADLMDLPSSQLDSGLLGTEALEVVDISATSRSMLAGGEAVAAVMDRLRPRRGDFLILLVSELCILVRGSGSAHAARGQGLARVAWGCWCGCGVLQWGSSGWRRS